MNGKKNFPYSEWKKKEKKAARQGEKERISIVEVSTTISSFTQLIERPQECKEYKSEHKVQLGGSVG